MKRVMSDEQQNAAGRRRSRRPGSTARVEALERLKSMRRGGRRSESGGFQIKMEEPIYDIVDEEEYQALVTKRRQEVRGFIVDDNGLGYGDEGEEEDWSQAQDGLDLSSGESDAERERQKRKKVEKKANEASQKKTGPSSGLSAAAALMGKQRISAMFTKSIFKKKEDGAKGLSCDSLVDDVIAEFAPDEADREMRRKGYGALPSKVRGTVLHSSVMTEVPHSGRGKMSVRQELNEVRGNNGDSRVGLEKNCGVPEGKNLSGECAYVADMTSEKSSDLPAEYDNSSTKASVIKDANVSEIKEEQVVRKGEGHSLNAIIVEEKDPALSATAGWQEVRSGEDKRNACDVVETVAAMNSNEKLDFELDSDGSLPFFIIDAHEEIYGANMGTLYLFGKVKAGCTYHSCCIVVRNMQRCVYAIPGDDSIIQNEVVRKLEKDAEEFRISHINLRKRLLEVASDLKNEVAKKLVDHNISSFSTSLVKRKYTFERSDIPVGDNYVLKINYSFKDPPLPADLRGETFRALLATHCSALELFLVKRKIIGPSWLAVAKFSICPAAQRVSWCKYEVTVDCPKDIKTSDSIKTAEFPPLVVTAMNLKTITNEKQNANEIVSASIICCHKVKIDTPMPTSEWKKSGALSHFTVVRKLDGSIFPMGFTKEAADRNSKAGSNVIGFESSERALLNRLLIELYKLDTDVLVGHNISMFDLDVLLHRAQACRVPSSTWSKIGRLKRSIMPKITKSNTTFGFGASPGIMSCIAGRLLCDTFLCSRDLLKEVSYSLSQLAKTQLNKDHKEVAPHDIPTMFQTAESLMELIEYNETNAWLSVELMFHLSILPLTRELTKISGNLWQKTLQGARAQRVEYLLLHAFHAKKYVVPDKISFHAKETKLKKRRVNQDIEEGVIDDLANDLNDDLPQNNHGKSKRAPAYSGGLVLDPKAGLYDKYILLLDFNSLYPSIIQEYNICFTTVERSIDGQAPKLPSSRITGVLPELLKDLVERRRRIKQWMKTASGLKFQQFDIRQQALKLTANSMYGCLGFTNSRFYAKPLAELITLQGREILQSTADLVQNNLNLEVIYGDTDSIMIYTGLDDITKAKAFAGKVIQEVNKKYRCLEIDLDGLYKRMLLLKKKKYAAVKVQFKDGTPYEVIERKGLDMVRRDWSLLSKELGDFCLSQILSGGSCDDVVETIHNALTKVREDMKNGEIALEKYVITKTLTKPPEAYPDGKNQPHVQVALRLRQNNYSTSCSVGDTVPYIICCEQGTSSSISPGIAQRARHPDELRRDDGKWMIDIDYYLSQQIHPVVLRLCAPIQGTSPVRLAECLGLDSSKFQSKTSETSATDLSSALFAALDDTERYQGCEPLTLSCPSCSGTFICPTVLHSLSTRIGEKQAGNQVEQWIQNFWHGLHCPRCPQEDDAARLSPKMIANQVKRQVEGFVARYYTGLMTCDDETCKYTTRSVNLRVFGDSERGAVCPNHPRCSGRLTRKYTEADLYKQLMYFCHVLDTVNCLSKVEDRNRILLQKELAKIRPLVESAAEAAQTIRDRCAYGWVRVNDLVVTV